MSKKALVLIGTVMLSACTQYMTATNFHSSLNKGITKQQFMDAWQSKNKEVIGGDMPASSRSFTTGNDNWEILIYNVYEYASVKAGYPKVDHKEYVAFKNGLLEEWGIGTLPLSLKNDPEVIHLETGQ